MATHSSILAWKILWTEEPGGLQSMWLQRVRYVWVHAHTHTPHLHSLAGVWHLGWLYILAIGTNAAETWESIYVFEVLFLVPLLIPRNGIDVVQLLNCVSLFAIPWTAACKSSLFFTISLSVLKVTSIQSVMPSNHLIFCCCLFLPPPIFPSIRGFSNESVLHMAKVLEFQLQHQSFQWTSRTNLL